MFDSGEIVLEIEGLIEKHGGLETAVGRVVERQRELDVKWLDLTECASGVRVELSEKLFKLPIGSDDACVRGAIAAVMDILEKHEGAV